MQNPRIHFGPYQSTGSRIINKCHNIKKKYFALKHVENHSRIWKEFILQKLGD